MGSDPAPFLPTYFFIIKRTDGSGRKIKRTDLRCARQFANVFHFIIWLRLMMMVNLKEVTRIYTQQRLN